MRYISLLFALLFTISSLKAQDSRPNYMPNTLIIKFKEHTDLAQLKAKINTANSILNKLDAASFSPIWKSEYSQQALKLKANSTKATLTFDGFEELQKIYSVNFSENIDAHLLAAKISRLPEVEYAEPRYLYYTTLVTNDPINNELLNFHNFDKAWDITQGSSEVIIGIVDSGVNYNHEDLKNKIWINENEIPDNGLDDDNNGFVDDVLGWDFWESGYTETSFTQDNNPFAEFSDHGTHVAGIATAEPNNGVGLAGTGFNARYMAVKAGGVEDNPSTPNSDESNAIGFGYEGILYAYMNGANIINCSWGGSGASLFGEDVVNTVTDGGGLIIAAAGNVDPNLPDALTLREIPGYPASYKNVLSVAALGTFEDEIAPYSSFGEYIDILARGTIRSSNGYGTNGYETYQGTSMASPVVAGLAALIKAKYPDWGAERIKAQIRASSISIDGSNSSNFKNKLGTGKIDAEKALLTPLPGLVIDSVAYLNESGSQINLGETGIARFFIKNNGAPTSSLTFTVLSSNPNFLINEQTIAAGAISENETKAVDVPISISNNFARSLSSEFRIDFSDASLDYDEFSFVTFDELQYDNTNVNNIAMSIAANGNIGFYDALNGIGGIGFVPYPDTANFVLGNLLFEGGIIMEANDRLVNTVRSIDGNISDDFDITKAYQNIRMDAITESGEGTLVPYSRTTLDNAELTFRSFAFDTPELSNTVILNYQIKNTSNTLSLSDVYFGLYNDWDIGNSGNNNSIYNAQYDVLFIQEDGESSRPLVAVATYANTSSVLAINNGFEGSVNQYQFNIYDGFSANEKRNSLKGGTNNTTINNADVSTVVASGPYYIPPASTASIGFVYAFGETEAELIEQINNARAKNDLFEITNLNTNPDFEFPNELVLFQNYPNPFNPSTKIAFKLEERGDTTLDIYNYLGQKVYTVIDDNLAAGIHTYTVSLDNLASGIYFAILKTDSKQKLIKLSLIK